MNPFFFGNSKSPLYGVYHPPMSYRYREAGIVFCYPYGVEYQRVHRAFVKFGEQLAREGFHVLRFDYTATGDSAGEDGEGRMDVWLEDVHTAIQELKDLSGVEKVTLIGVRLGAALATIATATIEGIDKLILWDPVVSGGRYMESLRTMHSNNVRNNRFLPIPREEEVHSKNAELLGLRCPADLRSSIIKTDLCHQDSVNVRAVYILGREDQEEYRELHEHFRAKGIQSYYFPLNEPFFWDNVLDIDKFLTPHKITSKILEILIKG